jgi:hypothetical protein
MASFRVSPPWSMEAGKTRVVVAGERTRAIPSFTLLGNQKHPDHTDPSSRAREAQNWTSEFLPEYAKAFPFVLFPPILPFPDPLAALVPFPGDLKNRQARFILSQCRLPFHLGVIDVHYGLRRGCRESIVVWSTPCFVRR